MEIICLIQSLLFKVEERLFLVRKLVETAEKDVDGAFRNGSFKPPEECYFNGAGQRERERDSFVRWNKKEDGMLTKHSLCLHRVQHVNVLVCADVTVEGKNYLYDGTHEGILISFAGRQTDKQLFISLLCVFSFFAPPPSPSSVNIFRKIFRSCLHFFNRNYRNL